MNLLVGRQFLQASGALTGCRFFTTVFQCILAALQIRQYCVLDDPTLAKVYQSQRKRYSEMLDAHAGVLPDDKLYQALRQDLNNLAQLQCNNSGPDAADPVWKGR